MRRTDTLIVGAGPAGAATAISLALSGRRSLLLEREREVADHICGGFLSWATLARLERLGVPAHRLSGAPIDHLKIFHGNTQASTRLPGVAMALSRHRLDTLLLKQALSLGVGLEQGMAVRAVEESRIRLADGAVIEPAHLVLATGKTDLRGAGRATGADHPTAGIRWRLAQGDGLKRLLGRAIELHLFRDGYAGLVLQEETANLCVAIRQSRLREAGGSPERLLIAIAQECPALADRLAMAPPIGKPLVVARVPYGWYARGSATGIYRVGDQAAVIPSLAGEGIAIALASGVAAATALMNSQPADHYQRKLAIAVRRPIAVAAGVWRVAEKPWGGRLVAQSVGLAPGLAQLIAKLSRVV